MHSLVCDSPAMKGILTPISHVNSPLSSYLSPATSSYSVSRRSSHSLQNTAPSININIIVPTIDGNNKKIEGHTYDSYTHANDLHSNNNGACTPTAVVDHDNGSVTVSLPLSALSNGPSRSIPIPVRRTSVPLHRQNSRIGSSTPPRSVPSASRTITGLVHRSFSFDGKTSSSEPDSPISPLRRWKQTESRRRHSDSNSITVPATTVTANKSKIGRTCCFWPSPAAKEEQSTTTDTGATARDTTSNSDSTAAYVTCAVSVPEMTENCKITETFSHPFLLHQAV